AGRADDALRWVQAVRHRAGVGAGGDGDVHGDEERFAEAELSGAPYKAKASTHSETATSRMTPRPNPWHVLPGARAQRHPQSHILYCLWPGPRWRHRAQPIPPPVSARQRPKLAPPLGGALPE